MTARRIAITGLGVMAPIGNSVDELLANLADGRSGVRRLPPALAGRLRSPIAATVDFEDGAHFDAPRLRMLDRVSRLALVAAERAIVDARLDFSRERRERCGVFVGCSLGGAETTDEGYQKLYAQASERVNPYSVLAAMTNAAASWIAIEHSLCGPNLTFATACSSSAVALGEAARRIQHGEVDVMLAGGAEAPLAFGVLRAWEALRTLATEDADDPTASCRPLSLDRNGLVIGEGAAFLVLEEWRRAVGRGATIHAELTGYGLSCDVGHIARPSVQGQASAMRAALASAALKPAAIGYINAHGSATMQNDAIETAAIKEVFG